MMIKRRQHGMTLTELLVAMGLTIMMLAATAMVFNSSTQAASKARAHNEIMQQLRAVTAQLERDFAGLRPDMPMAAIFDNHGQDIDGDGNIDLKLRQDRIVFFANGDFQTNMPPGWLPVTLSSNLARIYYGQSADNYASPQMEENDTPRWILTRRVKLLTSDYDIHFSNGSLVGTVAWQGAAWAGYPAKYDKKVYDSMPFEHATVSDWLNAAKISPADFADYYFNCDPDPDDNNSYARGSIIRPVNMWQINDATNNLSTDWVVDYNAFQRLYVLPDISDLKIQFWFPSSGRWFPDDNDMPYMLQPSIASSPSITSFAFYWNVGDMDPSSFTPYPLNTTIDWWSQDDIANFLSGANPWPTAIKFTFTLYDGGRRYFPEGRTFNYIIKLPEKK